MNKHEQRSKQYQCIKLKSLQMHQILETSSYIGGTEGTNLLILFPSIIIRRPEPPPPRPLPSYGTVCGNVTVYRMLKKMLIVFNNLSSSMQVLTGLNQVANSACTTNSCVS